MAQLELLILPSGECRYLQTPASRMLFGQRPKSIRRLSHVEPVALLPRLAFRLLRAVTSEYGRAAAWTRRWPCCWQVNFAPIAGPTFRTDSSGAPFPCRQAAIDFEVQLAAVYLATGAIPAAHQTERMLSCSCLAENPMSP
jgi:hypothetical protein